MFGIPRNYLNQEAVYPNLILKTFYVQLKIFDLAQKGVLKLPSLFPCLRAWNNTTKSDRYIYLKLDSTAGDFSMTMRSSWVKESLCPLAKTSNLQLTSRYTLAHESRVRILQCTMQFHPQTEVKIFDSVCLNLASSKI